MKLTLQQGRSQDGGSRGAMLNRRLSGFFYGKKTGKVTQKVTLFSISEVFCGPQICQKCVGGRGSPPGPRCGSSRRSPRSPNRLGRGHPSQSLLFLVLSAPRFSRLRRSASVAPM